MSRSFKFSCVLSAALAFAACGDDGDDGGAMGGNDAGAAGCTTDTYANYGMALFTEKCTICHGAQAATLGDNVRLDSLAAIIEHKPHVIEHAVNLEAPIMPSGTSGLPATDRERLKKWLNCGPK